MSCYTNAFYRYEKWVNDRTFYDILGVSPDSSDNDIKIAYRKLALKYHPDKNPNGSEMFQQITKSYKVLSSQEVRRMYDSEGEEMLTFGYIPQENPNTVEKILLVISLSSAIFKMGCNLEFELNYEYECKNCPGLQSEHSIMGNCHFCSGKGKVLFNQIPCEGTNSVKNEYYSCMNCTGAYQPIIECIECNGNGVTMRTYFVPVIIEKDLPNGYQFPLSLDVALPVSNNSFIIQLEKVDEILC